MKLGLHQSARLEQRLVQSPQMIQAMQILQLPTLDLEERIAQELTENPCLEVAEPDVSETREPDVEEPREPDGVEAMLEELERYERDFGDGPPRPAPVEEGDRKYEAMQNAPSLPQTLAEALLQQLAILSLDDRERILLEYVIGSLDERGYLPDSLEVLAEELRDQLAPPVELEELEDALDRLRSVTHPGMGARDLRESLLLQLAPRGVDDPLVRAIVSEHLEDLEANRLPRIARATGHGIEDVKEAIERIRLLDPIPGAEYGEARATVITPDVVVEEIDGTYEVRLDRQRVPRLTLSKRYRTLLQAAQEPKTREWVRKWLESARWFIDAVQQRQTTLERLARAVFKRQESFLDHGISGLKPLRMQEVADDLGVHISTVSRGVSGKYAQTPRGIFPMKFFFTGGTTKESGEVASQASIKQRIKEILAQEDASKPYSDDQVATLLDERDGIKIARRTVTKYRKALGIASSSQRRSY